MTQTVIRMIPALAPPAPQCYSSRDQWTEFLISAQFTKTRPFDGERYVPKFNFCADCMPAHRTEMQRVQRCDFKGYVQRRTLEARPRVYRWFVPLFFGAATC